MNAPFEAANPRLRAAAAPFEACRRSWTPLAKKPSTTAGDRSDEPSSMTITSMFGQVWASTLSRVAPMNASALKHGMMTDTRGFTGRPRFPDGVHLTDIPRVRLDAGRGSNARESAELELAIQLPTPGTLAILR